MKKFGTSINGYTKEDVNQFVAEVTKEYESMLEKLKSRDKELETVKKQIKQYKDIETTLNKAILVAEDSSNQIKKIANRWI